MMAELLRQPVRSRQKIRRRDDGGALLLLPLNTSPAPNADAPPSWPDLPIRGRSRMNPSHHGSDEQVFGAKQQVPHGGQSY
jgi:hypothetical protein